MLTFHHEAVLEDNSGEQDDHEQLRPAPQGGHSGLEGVPTHTVQKSKHSGLDSTQCAVYKSAFFKE